jgi:signal transduction histidine kinase
MVIALEMTKTKGVITGLTFIDVLTMSKLDSGLFVMTPIDVQLDSIARDAVKMFEGEARSAGVDLQFQLEDSCKASGIDRVSLDPTRVLQILIVTKPFPITIT